MKFEVLPKLHQLTRIGKVELGLIGGVLLVVAIIGYLVFAIQGPALRLTP
jgi:hypothetical protein